MRRLRLALAAALAVSGILATAGTASADTTSVTVGDVTVRKDGHSTKVLISGPNVIPMRGMVVCEGSATKVSIATPLHRLQLSESNRDVPRGVCSDPQIVGG